jgi:DNA repair exonuclease SbcCD ATPase subunit
MTDEVNSIEAEIARLKAAQAELSKAAQADINHFRNWKRKIESQVELTEKRIAETEARVMRLEAQKELRVAGGLGRHDADPETKS